MRRFVLRALTAGASASGFLISVPLAHAAFSDVPQNNPAFEAITYLQEKGVVQGYEDGTFRPNQLVNRAEAMKFIIAPLASPEALAVYTTSGYNDIPDEAWFLPYIEYGRERGVIDGPDKKPAFNGGQPVIKVEFLKMILLAQGLNPESYAEIRLPLSDDVPSPDDWFYPYLRFALATSMTQISQQGTLNPAAQLTRADTAQLLYRLLMYLEGRRTQALLSSAESEILIVLGSLNQNNIVQAEYASARALLAARGAHTSRPEHPVVLGALKITESFRALVRGYRAGLQGELAETIRLAGDAWNLSESAKTLNPAMEQLATQVQTAAKNMADSARNLQAGGQPAPPAQ